MSFRDDLVDDLNAISPAKGAFAVTLTVLGALAMWQGPALWPYFFPGVAPAFAFIGVAAAVGVVAPGAARRGPGALWRVGRHASVHRRRGRALAAEGASGRDVGHWPRLAQGRPRSLKGHRRHEHLL
jgi:hypothetical protein